MSDAPTIDADASPIFVIGASRSGTTLLRMILCAHPRIHLTMEASFYLWGATYGPLRRQDRFPTKYLQTFSFRWLRIDPRPILAALPRPFRWGDRKHLYGAVMRQQAASHGKVRHGDKTPGHSANLARIFRDFPDARVIRMVRDPREVVCSLRRMPWAPSSLILSSILVDLERKQVRRFRDRILEVRLADLLAEPRDVMTRVLDFVGEPFAEEVLDHARHAPDDLPPMPWFAAASKSRHAAPSQDRKGLDPVEQRLLEWLVGSSLKEQGLSPAALETEPGRWRVFRRWVRDLGAALGGIGIGIRLAWASRKGAAEGDVATRLLRRLNPAAWAQLPDFVMPDPPSLPDGWEHSSGDPSAISEDPVTPGPAARGSST